MGWGIGYDSNWGRDIGYGVPAECDHPDCSKKIDRGLGYVCGGDVYGGEHGCGLFFCGEHLAHYRIETEQEEGTWEAEFTPAICERCAAGLEPFDAKPDIHEWVMFKACHPSWKRWRKENRLWCWANVTLGMWIARQFVTVLGWWNRVGGHIPMHLWDWV